LSIQTAPLPRQKPGTGFRPHLSVPPWKGEKLYFKGDDYFRDLLKSIEKSRISLDFESYIFEPGHLGDRVLLALSRAVRRGVRVRLLVDGVGSPDFASHYGSRLEKARIPFKVYRSWPVFFSTAFRLFRFKRLGLSFRNIHSLFNGGKHRDHRKLCVVDGKQVWIGSFNVSDWHMEKIKGREAWRDTGMGLSGVTTYVFRLAFLIAWEDTWPNRRRRKYRSLMKRWVARESMRNPIRLTVTRRLRILFRKELLARFQSAQKRIWCLAPYFIPNHAMVKALADAARRGCDVRLILPGRSDVPMVRWASLSFYPALLRAGCRLFEYQKSVLHGKTLFMDSWVLVGSSNLDQRSLRKDLEINVEPQALKSVKALELQFQRDLAQSDEVIQTDLDHRPLRIRLLSWFFLRFRFWF